MDSRRLPYGPVDTDKERFRGVHAGRLTPFTVSVGLIHTHVGGKIARIEIYLIKSNIRYPDTVCFGIEWRVSKIVDISCICTSRLSSSTRGFILLCHDNLCARQRCPKWLTY